MDGIEIEPMLFGLWTKGYAKKQRHAALEAIEWYGAAPTIKDDDDDLMAFMAIGDSKNAICWGDTWETFIHRLESYESFQEIRHFSGDINTASRRIHIHARLVTALLVYLQVFKDSWRDGFPDGINVADLKYGAQGTKVRGRLAAVTVSAPTQLKDDRAGCLVMAHFRTYRHPSKCVRTGGKAWIGMVMAHARGCIINPWTFDGGKRKGVGNG